jgi:hypothetical protein
MVAGRYACQCDMYGGMQGDGVTARDGSDGRIVSSLRCFPSSLPCPRGPAVKSIQSKGKLVKVSDVRCAYVFVAYAARSAFTVPRARAPKLFV